MVAAPNELAHLEKRAWNLNGRVLRIVAGIFVGEGNLLREIVEIVFHGPGQADPANGTPVTIDHTEIDDGQQTFTVYFNGENDGWRWHGEAMVDEDGEISHVSQQFNPLQQEVGNQWVERPGNMLQFGYGWAN